MEGKGSRAAASSASYRADGAGGGGCSGYEASDAKKESGEGGGDKPFVNTGLKRWATQRAAWRDQVKSGVNHFGAAGKKGAGSKRRAKSLTEDEVDEVVRLLYRRRRPPIDLPAIIPLAQLIDIIVDVWDAEP